MAIIVSINSFTTLEFKAIGFWAKIILPCHDVMQKQLESFQVPAVRTYPASILSDEMACPKKAAIPRMRSAQAPVSQWSSLDILA